MNDKQPPVAAHGASERVKHVRSFEELATTPFADGINALCWPRVLNGNFAEVLALLAPGEGITTVDEARLRALPVGPGGRTAVAQLLEDQRLLREHGLDPALNCITSDIRDDSPGPVPTDVYSFHADSATIEADTWLCTYHGATSEGLANEDALRKVDVPEIRAELLQLFGGRDDEAFREFLNDHCYDLHYAARPSAPVYSFGLGNLWRIATEYPGCPVPPCIHRAPPTPPGQPRLLLIC